MDLRLPHIETPRLIMRPFAAGADPPNTASFRVIEKLGMKFAGKITINGLEAIYYVMNQDDFRSNY